MLSSCLSLTYAGTERSSHFQGLSCNLLAKLSLVLYKEGPTSVEEPPTFSKLFLLRTAASHVSGCFHERRFGVDLNEDDLDLRLPNEGHGVRQDKTDLGLVCLFLTIQCQCLLASRSKSGRCSPSPSRCLVFPRSLSPASCCCCLPPWLPPAVPRFEAGRGAHWWQMKAGMPSFELECRWLCGSDTVRRCGMLRSRDKSHVSC